MKRANPTWQHDGRRPFAGHVTVQRGVPGLVRHEREEVGWEFLHRAGKLSLYTAVVGGCDTWSRA